MSVFVLDTNKVPLAPCHEAKARILLNAGKAAIFRMRPFTIILKYSVESPRVPDLRIKLDPGSRTTGITVVDDTSGRVIFAAELSHRGQAVRDKLLKRHHSRRGRRARHTRYRQARWQNRRRRSGWLPPSLQSRIANVLTWVARLSRLCKIMAISLELVKFDMQLMENPEIGGAEYQQGSFAGYEVREYLLEKWGRECTYCGKENIPLSRMLAFMLVAYQQRRVALSPSPQVQRPLPILGVAIARSSNKLTATATVSRERRARRFLPTRLLGGGSPHRDFMENLFGKLKKE